MSKQLLELVETLSANTDITHRVNTSDILRMFNKPIEEIFEPIDSHYDFHGNIISCQKPNKQKVPNWFIPAILFALAD